MVQQGRGRGAWWATLADALVQMETDGQIWEAEGHDSQASMWSTLAEGGAPRDETPRAAPHAGSVSRRMWDRTATLEEEMVELLEDIEADPDNTALLAELKELDRKMVAQASREPETEGETEGEPEIEEEPELPPRFVSVRSTSARLGAFFGFGSASTQLSPVVEQELELKPMEQGQELQEVHQLLDPAIMLELPTRSRAGGSAAAVLGLLGRPSPASSAERPTTDPSMLPPAMLPPAMLPAGLGGPASSAAQPAPLPTAAQLPSLSPSPAALAKAEAELAAATPRELLAALAGGAGTSPALSAMLGAGSEPPPGSPSGAKPERPVRGRPTLRAAVGAVTAAAAMQKTQRP